ncbi:ribose-phosphate pyrophosphokinase 5 [Cladorrhinum samala]|uniref:ribose-phosphate diphosphokinase n=1 Tax=Cladorrhinum samala TaxID=585594 RepID=A0AAV9HNN3_9PEZI|nr:ribose-phosphate pyrophosphokinase 5 [Cladorrhinum samala]
MVRDISILPGSSIHPSFSHSISRALNLPGGVPSPRTLGKFSSGESRCEIEDSVRDKDVYILQTFGVGRGENKVNDYLMELLIMISACKGGSAMRVTAVLPMFPYGRQADGIWTRESEREREREEVGGGGGYGGGVDGEENEEGIITAYDGVHEKGELVVKVRGYEEEKGGLGIASTTFDINQTNVNSYTTHDYETPGLMMAFRQSKPNFKTWMAQSGSLVADLLTCAGADRILTCDLHESTYQGFFDIPVDNLSARQLLKRYIQRRVPNYEQAIIVSPDAGGAKRASAIADGLGMGFALIHKHKERRPLDTRHAAGGLGSKPTMVLVGDVQDKVCILVDDLADTANTIVRAAKLLKKEGRAAKVIALLTHGIFSGDALAKINASALDKVVVTNTIAQEEHCAACPKLEVLDISGTFAEAVRRVHHGESIGVLFQYD